MDDSISRQAAITLPVMPKEHREYQTYNLDDAYEQGWFDLQKCIEELPSAQPEPKWIPCSERLPEDSSPVLITHRGGVSYGWYNGRYFERGANTNHRKLQTVIAWMPLPKPWRGEANEKTD